MPPLPEKVLRPGPAAMLERRVGFCALILVALGLASPGAFAVSTLQSERVVGAATSAATVGIDYVRSEEFGAKFGLKAQRSPDGKKLTLQSPWTTIILERGSREIAHNTLRVFLGEAVREQRGHFLLSRIDAEKTLVPLLVPGHGLGAGKGATAPQRETVPKLKTIVIDPGHGGADPGKVNARLGVNEKTMTLDTAKRLQSLLEVRGYRVLLTRTADVALDKDKNTDLRARAHFANSAQADLFISLHYNAVGGSEATLQRVRGAEVYTLTPQYQHSSSDHERQDSKAAAIALPGNAHDHWSMVIAHEVHRALVHNVGFVDRGLKRARFAVLREVDCPALLVEAGFLSHDEEARKIATPEYRQQIAEALATGIVLYDAALEAARRRRPRLAH
ncbi:N-acetylmuramoyl-L-alanine amidase family protein [Cephaloticoccus primus]|uniref:N-acetylmuramoyl-L-alanine amidase family protein n=1 Tax=Cephaloticoccus primus TaxID=1548207 RepID=UPI0018D2DE08|nr:N-acetylmuramoyl-L-alanine amidase [Cephaloticoccus primus]